MTRDGDQVILMPDSVKMNYRHRRLLQILTVAVLLAYTSLLLYQSFSNGIPNRNNQVLSDKLSGKTYQYDRNLGGEHTSNDNIPSENEFTSEIPSATATMKPPSTSLDDVFISVKTTRLYHQERLPIILKTWFQLAKKQTWFFTDLDDPELQLKTNNHMINTNCTSSYERKSLCCKMSVEFDTYMETDKKWFCHFDDDNYVNVPRLVQFLGDYNPREDWYLGKTSIKAPLEIFNLDKPWIKVKFWFATGGAGFCISRALALKMMPTASAGKFISICEQIRLPDDVTMGYIIEQKLKKPLTVVDQFHSHLEPMKFIRRDMLQDQISFSYGKSLDVENVVKIEGFDNKYDPKRFLSLHCFLFPQFNFCPR